MYFTVNMDTLGYDKSADSYHTGFLWMTSECGKQLLFMIMSDCNDGMTDVRKTNHIILSEFEQCSKSLVNKYGAGITIRCIVNAMKTLLSDLNGRMYSSSCRGIVLGASVGILVISGNEYVSLQTGDSIIIRHGRSNGVMRDEADIMLGRHSHCHMKINSGRIRHLDTLIMCSCNYYDDMSMWYINSLLTRRRSYMKRGRYGIDGKDIMDCMFDILKRRNNINNITAAVVCCNNSVRGGRAYRR